MVDSALRAGRDTVRLLLWLAFGLMVFAMWRGIVHYADDLSALGKLNAATVSDYFANHIRVGEMLAVKLSALLGVEAWFFVSLIAYLVTAEVARRTANLRPGTAAFSRGDIVLFAAANPLMAQLLSQIDTVSQVTGNLFAMLTLFALALNATAHGDRRPIRWAYAFAILALVSKETFVGLPLAVVLVHLLQARRRGAGLTAGALALMATALLATAVYLWIKVTLATNIGTPDTLGGDGHYSIKLSPATLAYQLVFTLSAPLNPLPTAFLGLGWASYLYIGAGVAVFLGVLALLYRGLRSGHLGVHDLVWLAAVATPLILVKAAELYASALVPFLASLVLVALRRWAGLVAALLLIASLFNTALLLGTKCVLREMVGVSSCPAVVRAGAERLSVSDYSLYTYPPDPALFRALTVAEFLRAQD